MKAKLCVCERERERQRERERERELGYFANFIEFMIFIYIIHVNLRTYAIRW